MTSHAAVHAAKRKLQLSPAERGPEIPKKYRVENIRPKPTECHHREECGDHRRDKKNFSQEDGEEQGPVWVEDHYKVEIIGNLLIREKSRRPLGYRSAYIPYRHRIIDWMYRAKEALKLCEEVHQLAVYFFDRFVDGASTLFLEPKLDLHVLCCIQLAAKTLEWDNQIPRNSDLNKLLERPFPLSEYTEVERRLLLFFQWNLTLPVINTFLGLFRSYLTENAHDDAVIEELLRCASFFEKMAVKHVSLQRLAPSLTASAIVFASRFLTRVEPPWPNSLAGIVPYKELELLPHVTLLTKLLNNDNSMRRFLGNI